MNVVIYTDGSVSKNGHPDAIGGWACILQALKLEFDDRLMIDIPIISEIEKSGQLLPNHNTPVTNNRAEMYAILYALESINKRCDITVYSDSELVVKTINGEYAKRNNLDLWDKIEEIIRHLKQIGCSVELKWVKGHAGNALNNRVDKLASNAKKGIK